MIALALDPHLYPDCLHQQLKQSPLNPNMPWLNALFWIRRFYEEGNGRNYIQMIDPGANGLLNSEVATRVFNVVIEPQAKQWQLKTLSDLDKLRMECWMINSDQNGQQSQLTKGLRFLTKRLSPDFSEDEFENLMSELEGESYCSKGQLAAARFYCKHFISSLRSILSGKGAGWLQFVRTHPLHEANLAVWGIHVNGEICSIALRVRTAQEQITISQGGLAIEEKPHRGEIILLWKRLGESGFNPYEVIEVSGRRIPPFQRNETQLARVSRNEKFHAFLDPNSEEIQTAELWAVLPATNRGSFALDNTAVNTKDFPLRDAPELRLFQLDLREINRSQPRDLTLSGQKIIRVGAAPCLLASSGDPCFKFHDEPAACLVFGEFTAIELQDYYGPPDAVVWSGVEQDDAKQVLRKQDWGQKTTARATVPGRSYSVSVPVVFLPEDIRTAMVSENPLALDNLRWEPETCSKRLRARIQSSGLCPGTLTVGETSHRLSVASDKIHYWIRKGLHEILAHDTSLHVEPEDLESHLVLELYLPKGTHMVRWGGIEWFSAEGPGYWEYALSEQPKGATATNRVPLTLDVTHEDGSVTELLSLHPRPFLVREEDGIHLAIPEDFDVASWSYAIITEGGLGGRLGEPSPCGKLAKSDSARGLLLKLPVTNFHPDQGAALILWRPSDHGGASAEFLKSLKVKPVQGFLGPMPIQNPNPFRTASLFQTELGGMTSDEFPLQPWMGAVLTRKRPELNGGGAGWEEFLQSDFSVAALSDHLDQKILAGDNWLADARWGGTKLLSRSKEIENAYQTDPAGGIRRTKYVPLKWNDKEFHPCFHGLHTITTGKKPDAVWLPLEAFRIRHRLGNHGFHELITLAKSRCTLADLPECKRSIRFEYGSEVKLKYSDPPDWESFVCDCPTELQVPPWWPAKNQIGDFECPELTRACDIFGSVFASSMATAEKKTTAKELLALFSAICRWMAAEHFAPERLMIFQAAVLCRLHAWFGEAFSDERSRDVLRALVAAAWTNQKAKPILSRDLITTDWAFAWFRVSE